MFQLSDQVELQNVAQAFQRIAELLVDPPEKVRVELRCDSETGSVTLRVYCPKSAAGKIIGKEGRTAKSLRVLLQAIGARLQRKFSLDVQVSGEEVGHGASSHAKLRA